MATNRRIRILLLAGTALCFALPSWAATGDIIARLGPGGSPQWSPDGEWIAFVHDGFLQIAKSSGQSPRCRLAHYAGSRYLWASDMEIVLSEAGRSDTVYFKKISVPLAVEGLRELDSFGVHGSGQVLTVAQRGRNQGKSVRGPIRLPDGKVGYFELQGPLAHGQRRFSLIGDGQSALSSNSKNLPIVIVEQEAPYSVWGDLWLGRLGDSSAVRKRITVGQRYGLTEMSPGWDKFVAARMPGGDYTIFDTSGQILAERFEPITPGPEVGTRESASRIRWSPDGRYLLVVRSLENEETVVSERLLVTDVSGRNRSELYWPTSGLLGSPVWRPDGRAIAIDSEHDGILILEFTP